MFPEQIGAPDVATQRSTDARRDTSCTGQRGLRNYGRRNEPADRGRTCGLLEMTASPDQPRVLTSTKARFGSKGQGRVLRLVVSGYEGGSGRVQPAQH